jgi:hypothetical protein
LISQSRGLGDVYKRQSHYLAEPRILESSAITA